MDNINQTSVLVVGATGYLGMEICRQLAASGAKVTAISRTATPGDRVEALKQLGVSFVAGDLKDNASMKNALKGFSTVISSATSVMSKSAEDNIQSVDNEGQAVLVGAAAEAGVKHFIYVSVPEMSDSSPLIAAKRNVEDRLKKSGMSYTILKPTFFMEMWLSPALGFDYPASKATIYGEGKNKISWISLVDVASFVVASVNNPQATNKSIELGGPAALSPLEVVSIFEESSGKKFELQHVPVAVLQAQKTAAPDDLGKSFSSLMLIYASGNEIDMKEANRTFNVKMKSVREYANQGKA